MGNSIYSAESPSSFYTALSMVEVVEWWCNDTSVQFSRHNNDPGHLRHAHESCDLGHLGHALLFALEQVDRHVLVLYPESSEGNPHAPR